MVTAKLLRWYKTHGRHSLPWRHTRDPYKILVSEVMLQQTQVERVIPKYRAFLKRFPTLQKLARASAASVLRAWQGLGYNKRALFLKKCAEACVREHDGKIPDSYEALRQLPGVGDYTANAVLAFAFGKHVTFHDTNIRRIFSRVYFGKNPSAVAEKKIAEIVRDQFLLLPERSTAKSRGYLKENPSTGSGNNIASYYSALMDLGATVCRAKPLCPICPLQKMCKAAPKVLALSRAEGLARGWQALEGRIVRNPQSRFEGSDRQLRGRVVELLRKKKYATAGELFCVIPAQAGIQNAGSRIKSGMTRARVSRILRSLLRDGLVTKKGGAYTLPG